MCFIKHVKFSKSVETLVTVCLTNIIPVFFLHVHNPVQVSLHIRYHVKVTSLPTSHGHDMTSDFVTLVSYAVIFIIYILTFLLV